MYISGRVAFSHIWRYHCIPKKLPNPASDWLSDRAWGEVLMLAALVRNIMQHSYRYTYVCVCMYAPVVETCGCVFPGNIRKSIVRSL